MHQNPYIEKLCSIIEESKYRQWYLNLINTALHRQGGKFTRKTKSKISPTIGYCETHHILPKCICDSDEEIKDKDNLVVLTAREHLLAHLILFKAHPKSRELGTAVQSMGMKSTSTRHRYNTKLTAATKCAISNARKESYVKEDHPRYGAVLSESTKDKISNSLLGRKLSPEHKEKVVNGIIARTSDPDWVHPNRGRTWSDETKQLIRQSCKQVKKTPEWNDKNSKANTGRIHIANTVTKERRRPLKDDAIRMVEESNGIWIILSTRKPIPDYSSSE